MSIFKKKIVFVLAAVFSFPFYSCSSKTSDVDIQEYEKKSSCDCRGFDFDKKFPNKRNRPYAAVGYDLMRKLIFNKDGTRYLMDIGDGNGLSYHYNDDLPQSEKEKKYIKKFKEREREFDKKYAGEIKKKLRNISKITKNKRGQYHITYPTYLEGSELPEGLVTPASFFSEQFFKTYIIAEKHPGELREYILSTELYRDFAIRDLAAGVGQRAAGQIYFRLRALYVEYVLTYYLKKDYSSPEERHRTAVALAEYYSDVAFRGAAESLYYRRHLLTSRQRCKVANYIAHRVHDLVMVIDRPESLNEIKKEYLEELNYLCFFNLISGRGDVMFPDGKYSKEEKRRIRDQLELDVIWERVRCVND